MKTPNVPTIVPSPWPRYFIIAAFIICPTLFFTDLTRNPYYTQIALLNIFICLSWGFWLFESFKTGEFVWVRSALDVPLLGLLGVCLVSWVVSWIVHPGVRVSIYSEGSRAMIFMIVNVYLVYSAALRSQDRTFFVRLLYVTYAVSALVALYGICQYFGMELVWPKNLNPYGSRPVSTFGNPNFMSSFLVLVIPVVFVDIIWKATGLPRVILTAVFVSILAALTATLTRSSWGGAVLALAVVGVTTVREAWARPTLRRWVITGFAAFLLVVVFWPKSSGDQYSATVTERLAEVKLVTTGKYNSASQRFLIWMCAWSMVETHPVLGQGWGCFELFYPFYQGSYLRTTTFRSLRTHANNAHDEILEYWSQVGTLGLGLVILLWIVFFSVGISIARRAPDDRRPLVWGLMAGVAGMLADNMLNVSVHFAVPAFLFWWWVGSVFILGGGAALKVQRLPVVKPTQKMVAAGALLILLCFTGRAFCMWMGEVDFFRGFKLSKAGVDLGAAQNALESAYQWHHLEVNSNYELANVYARTGQKERALDTYGVALAANAGYDEVHFNQGTILMQSGQIDRAIQSYQIALLINPLSRDAYNAMATVYLKDLPRFGAALEKLYLEGTSLYPDDKDMWNNLGYVYTQDKKWSLAYDAYRHALQADPEFQLAWQNLHAIAPHISGADSDPLLLMPKTFQQVDSLLSARNWTLAQNVMKPLLEALPHSYRAHFYQGNIFYGMGRLDEASKEYYRTTELKPDFAGAWQNLGVCLDALGHPAEAKTAYQHLSQLDPHKAVGQNKTTQ